MKITAALIACVLSSYSAFSAQMASQPWVNSRLDELHTNILDEVSHYAPSGGVSKAYVDEGLSLKQDKLTAGSGISITTDGVISAVGGGSQDYDPTTDMWIEDGTNMCFMVGTNKVKLAIISVTSSPYAKGFQVIESEDAGGAVSNGMFYAEVENGRFRCPSNARMPLIEFDGINTQVVDGVTNEYKRVTALEYERGTNGVTSVNRYESAQKTKTDWIMRSILSDLSVRDFRIRMTMGPDVHADDQPEHDSPVSRFGLSGLLFGSSNSGTSMDFSVKGMSGNLIITLSGVDKPVVVPIAYSGPFDFDYAKKDPTVPRVERSEPDADGKVKVIHFDWDSNPYPSYESFVALGNWLPPIISYTYTTVYGDTYVKNIPISTINKAFGGKLVEELAKLWQEPSVVEWTTEEFKSCRGDGTLGHFFMAKTCTCKFCFTKRDHKFAPGDPGLTCKTCINLVGWEKKPSDSYCGGHSSEEEDHGGYHHVPEDDWNPPPSPGSYPGHNGYLVTCSCQCGDIKKNHAYGDDSETQYSKGDIYGRDENKYHTKSMGCWRCQLSPYGWKAEVEGHVVSGEGSIILCIKEGAFNEATGYLDPEGYCLPTDPDVDKEGHMAKGECKKCLKSDVFWKVAHTFTEENKCECSQCHAKLHVFCKDTCPGVAWCLVCNKVFRVQDGVVNYEEELDLETEPKYHLYSDPESQIENNFESHVCLCVRKILHPHTWNPVSGDSEGKMVCGQAPDGTAGCGMVIDHDSEHCDSEKCVPYGSCTAGWHCRICGKDISGYDGAPPNYHGNVTDGAFEPEKDKSGNVVFCAVCKHVFTYGKDGGGSVRCGTGSDGALTPTRIYDENVHGRPPCSWKPQSGTLGSPDVYHECTCKHYSKFHNWDDYIAESMNERYHRVLRECDLGLFDDCHRQGSYEEKHNFVWKTDEDTGLPTFVAGKDPDKCGAATVCKTVHNGEDIGCGKIGYDEGSHEWKYRENVGLDPRYRLASTDRNDPRYLYHFHEMVCEHRFRGKDGEYHFCGCHKERPVDDYFYEVSTPGVSLHEKVYESSYLNVTQHHTIATCDKEYLGCYFYEIVTNSHNKQHLDWVFVDDERHQELVTCQDNGETNPGCHEEFRLEPVSHSKVTESAWKKANNQYHFKTRKCEDCNHDLSDLVEEHPRYAEAIMTGRFDSYPKFRESACEWHSEGRPMQEPLYHWIDVVGNHIGMSICYDCAGYFEDQTWRLCRYETSGSFTKGDDGFHLKCDDCGKTTMSPDTYGKRYLNRAYHADYLCVKGDDGGPVRCTPAINKEAHDIDDSGYCWKCDTVIPGPDEKTVEINDDVDPYEFDSDWSSDWPPDLTSVIAY